MACQYILDLRKRQSVQRARYRQAKRDYNQNLKNFQRINYDIMTDPQTLLDSFEECKQHVMWKRRVQYVGLHVISEIWKLSCMLQTGYMNTRPYRRFQINERGKIRDISSPDILERVIQHSLYKNIVYPILIKCLIYDNGASIKGKGVQFSRDRVTKHLTDYYRHHGNKGYVVQIDFKKFFESLDHDVIMEQLSRKIPDVRILNLCKQILDKQGERGVGLGSELSQIIALYYPNRIDHYFKDKLGVKYYGRYMDDIYIICDNYEDAVFYLRKVNKLAKELKLTVNQKKSKIVKLENGFTFLKTKYIMSSTGKISRISGRASATRERRKLRLYKKRLINNVDPTSKYAIDEFYIRDAYLSWRRFVESQFNSYNLLKRMDQYFIRLFGFKPIKISKQERREHNEQLKYIRWHFERFHPVLRSLKIFYMNDKFTRE